MRLKDKILIAAVAVLIVTWLFPPMSEHDRYPRRGFEPDRDFDGFHFILSNDTYTRASVLKIDWTKLVMLDLVIAGIGGVCCFVVSRKN